jgi:hypothetical protein
MPAAPHGPIDGDARPHPLDRQPQLRKNRQLMSRLVLSRFFRVGMLRFGMLNHRSEPQ